MEHRHPPDAEDPMQEEDPERTGGLTSGAALGASQAPIGHDEVTRREMREVDERPSTQDLIEELHEAVAGGTAGDPDRGSGEPA